ncbi:MAG: MarR family transcriptional regulator [Bacteroidota bacterium]
MARQKDLFKPYGVTSQQFNVLRILRGSYPEPISTSDIRERMLDKMSDVSRIVDRLVKKNLVSRRTCKSDKRLVDVLITEKGLELLKDMDNVQIMGDQAMSNLSTEEAETLNELLDKLRGK